MSLHRSGAVRCARLSTRFVSRTSRSVRGASGASLAVTVKAVLDTPLLTEEGDLTEASAVTCRETSDRIARIETEQA